MSMFDEKEPELIATIGDSYSDVKIEIYKNNNKYSNGANFKIITNRAPKLLLEFTFSKTYIDNFSLALKECGTFSQAPSEEQLCIREKLGNFGGDNNCEKIDYVLSCLNFKIKREKENEEERRKLLRKIAELEYKDQRIKDLIKNSEEIIEGTALKNMETEEIIKRLLNERRRAQLALAGVFDTDRPQILGTE